MSMEAMSSLDLTKMNPLHCELGGIPTFLISEERISLR
jgi:hypothetical protein